MSVWLTIPSKRPPEQARPVLEAWRAQGYGVMLWCDTISDLVAREPADPRTDPGAWLAMFSGLSGPYPGYAKATNALIKEVFRVDDAARWCVIGGDDVWPDPTKRADEIARECEMYFGDLHDVPNYEPSTFGVMQPTGDRWQDTPQMRARFGENRGALIDRVAGSAWIGREFALRAYGGNGPLWHEYTHMYVDEELQCVAEKLDVFWQRRDLTQRHEHWAREKPGETMGHQANMPEFLKEANSPQHWDKYGAIFRARQAAGFPGHEVKP